MLDSSLIALLAGGTAIAAGWSTIRAWVESLLFVPFQCGILPHTQAHWYVIAHESVVLMGRQSFALMQLQNREDVQQHIGYGFSPPVLFLNGWKPFLVTAANDHQYHVWTLRGLDLAHWIDATSKRYFNALVQNTGVRFGVYRKRGNGSVLSRATQQQQGLAIAPSTEMTSAQLAIDAVWPFTAKEDRVSRPRSIVELYAVPSYMERVTKRIKNWLDSRAWYKEHHLPWRLGALLTGAPGTGKSTYVLWIAETLNLPIYTFDLASMSNSELATAWSEAAACAPCIVLLEDIDAIFDGRKNIVGDLGGGLTFDALLNTLNGVHDYNGLLVFVTSNHPERIDPALRCRPGRIDLEVEIRGLEDQAMVHMATALIENPQTRERILAANRGLAPPAAEFKSTCVAAALEDEARKHEDLQVHSR